MSCALIARRLLSVATKRLSPCGFVRSFARLECAGVLQERKEMEVNEQNCDGAKQDVNSVLQVYLVPNGEQKQNAYILCDREESDGALIDPGTDDYKLLRALEHYRVNVTKIFLTHAHKGHVKCIQEFIQNIGDVTVYLHEADRALLDANVSRAISSEEMDIQYLKDNDEVIVGTHKGIVYHTPGHTPGSLCYHFGHFLFSGDTLLCNKVGETSYPESDLELMKKSIRESLLPLKKDTLVLPGHGPFTSIGTEAHYNPFLGK